MIILIWSHNTGIADDRIVIIWSHKSKFVPCSFVCLTTLSWQIVWQWWSGCTIFCSSLASTFVTDNLIVMIWPHQTRLVTCPCSCLIVLEKITIVVIWSRQLKWVHLLQCLAYHTGFTDTRKWWFLVIPNSAGHLFLCLPQILLWKIT